MATTREQLDIWLQVMLKDFLPKQNFKIRIYCEHPSTLGKGWRWGLRGFGRFGSKWWSAVVVSSTNFATQCNFAHYLRFKLFPLRQLLPIAPVHWAMAILKHPKPISLRYVGIGGILIWEHILQYKRPLLFLIFSLLKITAAETPKNNLSKLWWAWTQFRFRLLIRHRICHKWHFRVRVKLSRINAKNYPSCEIYQIQAWFFTNNRSDFVL